MKTCFYPQKILCSPLLYPLIFNPSRAVFPTRFQPVKNQSGKVKQFFDGCNVCAWLLTSGGFQLIFAAGAAKSPSRCRARAPTKRTLNPITDLPLHIPEKVKNLAVRRELVFDECGGASRRRRQAHVFLTAQINNLTRRAEKGIRADPLANCLFLPRGGTGSGCLFITQS